VSEPVVSVESVSMGYRLYAKPADMLREALFGGVRHDTFWALRDVSLNVYEGERVGIIGHNGAGKSTLLQLIAGNLQPTTGRIGVNGRISSLLSLVPSWNGDETGLENIKFNLLIQGVDARDMPAKIDDIVDFTDLGPFIYQPLKTYSTGMSARLAFAIATAIDPEILILDEVLGAGDGYFAGRAARRMQTMCDRGKALLFVSHATAAVRMICDTCIWLENGQVRLRGPVETVVRQYEEDILPQQDETLREGNRRRLQAQHRLVTPDDIGDGAMLRLRIRPEGEDPRITQTHYLRRLAIKIADDDIEVPLEIADIRRDEVRGSLDLYSCEWGRIFDRHGTVCRALLPRTGVRKGGHILAKWPLQRGNPGVPIEASFEVWSEGAREILAMDYLDVRAVTWQRLETIGSERLGKGWMRIHARGVVQSVAAETAAPEIETAAMLSADVCRAEQDGVAEELSTPRADVSESAGVVQSAAAHAIDSAIAKATRLLRSPVTIESVTLEVDGEPTLSLRELQGFVIKASLIHHEPTPGVSVNINIIRSDGAYVFYQPSGLGGRNIVDFEGRSEVLFHFDPNAFGAGEYEVNLFAVNAFSWDNIPPSEIYDRSIGKLVFRVHLARPIAFGLVNLVVPVSLQLHPAEGAVPADLSSAAG